MKTTTLSAIIGAVLASTAAAPAQTVTLNPTDDARVLATEPNNAAGGQHWLSLYHSGGNVQRIFLNFDLATYAGRALTTDATLTLRGHSAWGDYLTGVGLGTANAAWTEGTITWNNQPGITVVPGATNPAGNFPGNPDVPWTIPWYVVEKWATDGYQGIGLTSGSGSRLHFQSKEHPDNNPPRLEFTHTDSADGVWTSGAGNWTDAGNWQGGNVARGIDRSATFHGLTAATATLDADHTVGSLSFDNADHAIAAGAGRLALSTTAGIPTVFVGAGRIAAIAAPILGFDGLAKTGAGTLILSGNNSYTGGTTVSDGTLSVGALADSGTSHLGPSGTLTFDGGTLRYTGAGGTTNRNVAFPGAGTIEVAAGSALSLLGKWTGNGGITKTGDGTLTVGNNYTSSNRFNIGSDSGGAFTLEAGTLNISPSNYFTLGDNGQNASYTQTGGAANFTAPSGTYIGNGNSGTSTFTVSGGVFTQTQNVMRVGQNGSSVGILTVGGGAGTATVSAPTVTLGSNNAAASGTVNLLANGRLITGAVNKGSGTGTFNFDGGTLQPIASNSTFMQGLTAAYVNAGGANIDTAGNDVTIAQPLLDGGGGLTKAGAGILTLTGQNTYTGATHINTGVLALTGGQNRLMNSPITVAHGATLTCQGHAQTLNAIFTLSGGTVGGTGESGWGSWILRNQVRVTADSTMSAVRMTAANSGSGGFNVDPGVTLNVTGTIENTNEVSTVHKTGGGTMVLSGTNTYTGETIFAGGTVNVASLSDYGAASAIGARTFAQENTSPTGIGLHFVGGTLQYTGSTPQSTNRQIRMYIGNGATIDASGSNPDATLSFTHSGPNINLFDTPGTRTLTLTGTNTGDNLFAIPLTNQGANATSLSKTGTGTWIVTGDSTYTGATTINAGTLMLNGSLGSTAMAVNSGGTLGGTGSIGGVVTVNAGGTHAPGASVGSQAVGGETWMPGGRFEFEINDALGQPGGPVGWDELLVDGTLDLTNLSAQDPFYIDIVSLSGAAPGDIDNFVATEPVEWPFLRYETLAGDFSGDLFSVDSSQFSNPTGQGHFRVVQMEYEGADWLAIGYVPEPGAWLLLLSAAACGLLVRRRK